MRAYHDELVQQLRASDAPYVDVFNHGTMSLGLYAPRGIDRQDPHKRDELYLVVSGTAQFESKDEVSSVAPGDALFVAAGDTHRFVDMSDDFVTWVVFWGKMGGESDDHASDDSAH